MPRKSKPFELGGKYFQLKKELQEYVQSLLANGHRVLVGEEASVIQDLLLLHPNADEKIGTGLKYIEVSLSPQKTHNCFFVVRKDGSKEDFSYKHCVSECSQARLIEKRRLSAYREAVQDQIINFKLSKSRINGFCELCNSNQNLQVDHIQNFVSLVKDFEESKTDIPTEFEDADGTLYSKRFCKCDALGNHL